MPTRAELIALLELEFAAMHEKLAAAGIVLGPPAGAIDPDPVGEFTFNHPDGSVYYVAFYEVWRDE